MLNKVAFTLVTAGVMVASAAAGSFKISILQDSVIEGKQVKAGDYKVELKDNNTAVLKHGKQTIDLSARTETAPSKFESTEMEYTNNNDLQEIRIGGTTTRIVFAGANGTTAAPSY
jgi:hypothetical protein